MDPEISNLLAAGALSAAFVSLGSSFAAWMYVERFSAWHFLGAAYPALLTAIVFGVVGHVRIT